MKKGDKKTRKPPGPKPEVLKIEGNWKDAMRKLISRKRPADGWPKQGEQLMKRIGVVTKKGQLPAVQKCLADGGVTIISAREEQADYSSVYVADSDLDRALDMLRGKFDAAEMTPSPDLTKKH